VRDVTVTWPNGAKEGLGSVGIDQTIVVRQDAGVVARVPFTRR
jgi:hypothetical protein